MELENLPPSTRWCCRRVEFREVVMSRDQEGPDGQMAKAIHERCAVCGNNHYILQVPPIQLGITGAAVG